MNDSMREWKVPAVVKLRTDVVAASPALITFAELKVPLHIVTGQLQMPQGTSAAANCHMMPGSGRPQSNKCIEALQLEAITVLSLIHKLNAIEPISFYHYLYSPCQITMEKLDMDE